MSQEGGFDDAELVLDKEGLVAYFNGVPFRFCMSLVVIAE